MVAPENIPHTPQKLSQLSGSRIFPFSARTDTFCPRLNSMLIGQIYDIRLSLDDAYENTHLDLT